MKITFYGAANTVTGSKHLIEIGDFKLLLDCGLYQGKNIDADKLNSALPFNAKEIDAVILSHAHLDHCGALPLLVKNGYLGKIYSTGATRDIAQYIMTDSASIQKHEATERGDKKQSITPIYTEQDVEETMRRFIITPYYRDSGRWTKINDNISFKFYDAGHILGSAVTLLKVNDSGALKTLAYTGDLGRPFLPILRAPEFIEEAVDDLVMECTYGDKSHRPFDDVLNELKSIISSAVSKKSKIIIPAFSVGRTQEIVYILHKLTNERAIPALPIFVDSPTGRNVTAIFPRYIKDFDEEYWRDFGKKNKSAFQFTNLKYIKSHKESLGLSRKSGPLIIISSSGMAEGGRVVYHLKNNIGNRNSIILITGYQAEDTLGRKIQEGNDLVTILGENYPVRAKIITLDELSAHAGQDDLISFIRGVKNLKRLFLVHTEKAKSGIFKNLVNEKYPLINISVPSSGEVYNV
ncbi:MAG: MBL fold metallo-hydrolase [bacterium]